jgi:hypothetical protein
MEMSVEVKLSGEQVFTTSLASAGTPFYKSPHKFLSQFLFSQAVQFVIYI